MKGQKNFDDEDLSRSSKNINSFLSSLLILFFFKVGVAIEDNRISKGPNLSLALQSA